MELIATALVVLLLVVLFGLLLILGLVRRLRVLGERVSGLESRSPGVDVVADGAPVADFESVAATGDALTAAWFDGTETVVAFVTYGCSACTAQLPVLRTYGEQGGRILTVAARVRGEEPEPAGLRAAIGPAPVVLEEDFGGPVQTAFRVDKYPSFFLVGADRSVRASAASMRDLVRFRDADRVSSAST